MRRTTSVTLSPRVLIEAEQRSVSSSFTLTEDNEKPVILATGSHDHTLKLWDLSNGVCYRTLQHADTVNALAISPDARHLAVAGNPKIKIYEIDEDTDNKKPPTPTAVCDGHVSPVTCVGFHELSRWMYSAGEDGTIKFWDLRDFKNSTESKKGLKCVKSYNHRAPVNTVVLHPTQLNMISGDQNGSVRIWDLVNDTCTHELIPEPEVAVRSIAVTSDGKMVAMANNKGDCYIWHVNNPLIGFAEGLTPFYQLRAHSTYILKCTFSPDGETLATASADKTIKLWKVPEFICVKTLEGHQRWVWDCVFSSDSKFLISASTDHTARLWNVDRDECIRQFEEHMKGVVCVSLFDGRMTEPSPSLPQTLSASVISPKYPAAQVSSRKPSSARSSTLLKKATNI